jgi:hypothetical protein
MRSVCFGDFVQRKMSRERSCRNVTVTFVHNFNTFITKYHVVRTQTQTQTQCVWRKELAALHFNGTCNVRETPHTAAWSRILLEKLTGLQLVKNFPAFYGTRRFITTFTSYHHLSLSWTNSIQSIPPHPTSWKSTLILYSHLRLSLPSGLFP